MIKLICVGKIKEKYIKEAIEEYVKRLQKYIKLEIIEVADYNYDDINSSKLKEKEQILKFIGKKDYIITLEIDAVQIDSQSFAKEIDNLITIHSNIIFVIGGSNGLHSDIISKSNYHLSFSKMTFPHKLFRVILLEQIYRAFKIKNNETYHK